MYSLAILLWQLDSREVPFTGHHPQAVMYQVVARGVRPPPPSEAGACVNIPAFTSLYKSCWHTDPAARPSCQVLSRVVLILGLTSLHLRKYQLQ